MFAPSENMIIISQSNGYDDIGVYHNEDSIEDGVLIFQRGPCAFLEHQEVLELAQVLDGLDGEYTKGDRVSYSFNWGSFRLLCLENGNHGDWVLIVGKTKIEGSHHWNEFANALRG